MGHTGRVEMQYVYRDVKIGPAASDVLRPHEL